MKIFTISLFLLGLIIGASPAQESRSLHKPHPHKHEQYAKKRNPVPMTGQSVEKGGELFAKHCTGCHGESGKGAGSLNLTDEMVIHGDTDGEIFHVITDGAKGTQMKGFRKALTDEARWNLVNYIKSLNAASRTDPAAFRPGKHIRMINLKGYTLMYHMLDLSDRNEMMKKMEGHSVIGMKKGSGVTNHLMVYIQKPDGKIVPGDVAFSITDPNGKNFTTMTMPMYGGYGADLDMQIKGSYIIRTGISIETGEKVKLNDEFTYPVK